MQNNSFLEFLGEYQRIWEISEYPSWRLRFSLFALNWRLPRATQHPGGARKTFFWVPLMFQLT